MKGYALTVDLPVLWGDMDALRHVNNARYFAWFETARIAYLDRVRAAFPGAGAAAEPTAHAGGHPQTPGFGEVGPILASTSCDYFRPVLFPGTVRVGARVSEIGNSSLRMEYEVTRTDAPAELCARGTSVVVLVRYATLAKVRVPDEVRAAIAALEKGADAGR